MRICDDQKLHPRGFCHVYDNSKIVITPSKIIDTSRMEYVVHWRHYQNCPNMQSQTEMSMSVGVVVASSMPHFWLWSIDNNGSARFIIFQGGKVYKLYEECAMIDRNGSWVWHGRFCPKHESDYMKYTGRHMKNFTLTDETRLYYFYHLQRMEIIDYGSLGLSIDV